MKLLTRRSFLTAAAALVLPATGAILVSRDTSDKPRVLRGRRQPAQINVFSRARLPLGVAVGPFMAAMQRYVDDYLEPVWGTPAVLRWSNGPVKGVMNLVFTDQSDAAGAIAYHNLDPSLGAIQAFPYGEISVYESYTNDIGGLSVAFSHELCEMLVNPGINNWAGFDAFFGEDGADPRLRALEVADPVERTYFKVNGFNMSNFVYPAYFEPWRDGQLDFLGLCKEPGEILEGGYQIVRDHEKAVQVVNEGELSEFCWRVKRLTAASTSPPRKSWSSCSQCKAALRRTR